MFLLREALVSYHARLMHVVLVSEDLDAFAHVHPEDFPADNPAYQDGAVAGAHANFTVRATFPKAGKYLMALNYRIASSVTGLDVIEDSPHVHPCEWSTLLRDELATLGRVVGRRSPAGPHAKLLLS